MRDSRARIAELQRRYFETADVERYRWTTRAAGFVETEDELLSPVLDLIETPCLEIGCGEGNNLVRLGRRTRCFGVDLFRRKLHFAAREVPKARFATASADRLPFADASFRSILIRDLLHHMEDPRAVLEEAMRVLAPGGRFWLLEPNARNPIIRLQIRLVEAEAGARKFNADYVRELLAGLPLEDLEISAAQPFPLRRAVLHYELGLPALGRWGPSRALLSGAEKLIGALVPRAHWLYVSASATRG